LPVRPVQELNGFELILGKRYYLFRGGETPFNNSSSAGIASDKYCTNKLLERAGVPVPKAISLHVSEFEEGKLEEKLRDLTFPLVIKPLIDGAKGLDVLCNIQTIEHLNKLLHRYFLSYEFLIIEEFHGNLKSYRVLVFNKRVIGVVLRFPASVIGDGRHTINELVELTNRERQLNSALGPIKIDDECHIKLKELGIDADYIPPPGVRIVLCYTSNATRGGLYKSLGNKLCRKNRKLMIRVASLLNLNFTGIDVECSDINIPIESSGGVIIEVNHRPSIRIHEFPISGRPNYVTRKIARSFIYRHPFSYLYALYSKQPSAFYVRSFILFCFVVIIGVIISQ